MSMDSCRSPALQTAIVCALRQACITKTLRATEIARRRELFCVSRPVPEGAADWRMAPATLTDDAAPKLTLSRQHNSGSAEERARTHRIRRLRNRRTRDGLQQVGGNVRRDRRPLSHLEITRPFCGSRRAVRRSRRSRNRTALPASTSSWRSCATNAST
jgi:hypothetical protein